MKRFFKLILVILITCLVSFLIYQKYKGTKEADNFKHIIIMQSELEEKFAKDIKNHTFDNPKVMLDPYGNSPLSALIMFETATEKSVTLTIKGEDKNTTYTKTFDQAKEHYLPIYGLYANTENEITITVDEIEKTLYIQTAKLPDDFVLTTNMNFQKDKLSQELYFVTPADDGYNAAYDINGDVRWYTTESYNTDLKRLDNGHLLVGTNRLNDTNDTIGLIEIDLLGKVYHEYVLETGFFDDVEELINGNFLIISNNNIVELDRNTGKIIKTIIIDDLLTNLDLTNFENKVIRYNHKNNTLTILGYKPNLLLNINYETKEVNWLLSNEDLNEIDYIKLNDNWPVSMEILPNDELFLIINQDNFAKGTIYKVDAENMGILEIQTYPANLPLGSYANIDYLDTNHYLLQINNLNDNNSSLYDIMNNEIIWQSNFTNQYFGAEKLSLYGNAEYHLGLGTIIGNLGITPLTPTKKNINVFFNTAKIPDRYNIGIRREIDRVMITGTFPKDIPVYIILDNMVKNKVYEPIVINDDCLDVCYPDATLIKYINNDGLTGKYRIYFKVGKKIYDTNQYVIFE